MPRYLVEDACWSRSTSKTFLPNLAKAEAVFTAVVVLPVPPLKIEKLMVFAINGAYILGGYCFDVLAFSSSITGI